MSGNLILDIFIVFFICFGVLSLLHEFSDTLLTHRCRNAVRDFSVLYIEKTGETLELTVRCAIRRSLQERRVLLVIYNELSEEETFVLWRLCDQFEHVFIAQKEDAESAFLSAYKASS